jgi:hypothetical protein
MASSLTAAVFQISVAVLPPIPARHVIVLQSDALPGWHVAVWVGD